MLVVKICNSGFLEKDLIIIEVSQTKGDENLTQLNWESTIEKYAKSDKRVIFHLKDIDDDGIVSILIRLWLQFRDEIQIKSSKPWIKEVIRLAHGDKAIFVDKLD